MKDDLFGNMKFLESLSRRLGEQEQILEPIRLAVKQLDFSGIQKLYDIYDPLEGVLGNLSLIEDILGIHFQELVRPSVYLPDRSGIYTAVCSFAPEHPGVGTAIDTSWVQQANPWLTDVSRFHALDTGALTGMNTEFSKLIRSEQATSGLGFIADRFSEIPSAAAQLASIETSLAGIAQPWRGIIAPLPFLDNYSSFVLRQHTLIQKAASAEDDKSVEWRLDLLDATSRFVDRQITWASDFAADIQEDMDPGDCPDIESELDLSVIPQYIGYSKRDEKAVDETLAESGFAVITEKGKMIAQKALLIRKYCRVNHGELLFGDTDQYVGSYVTLAGTFCRNANALENVVDALYHLFYTQRTLLCAWIDLNDFACIEQIRILKEQGVYPERPREIFHLQERLYDGFLKLEDAVMERLETDPLPGQPAASVDAMLSEDRYTEETMSRNIWKALLRVQGNRTFYGKKEDELNDGVRDALSMIYEIKDQTRQGTSPGGKDAGEVDLQICRDGFPIAVIEGLKVRSADRKYIQAHMDKALTCYDPFGCPHIHIIIYAAVKKFADFWEKCLRFIREEYHFPYTVKEEIRELNHIYTASRHAKTVLLSHDREVAVHVYALQVQEP